MAAAHAQTGTMQPAWALMLQLAPTQPGSLHRSYILHILHAILQACYMLVCVAVKHGSALLLQCA